MENLDFGWEFGLMILIIVMFIYLLIVYANYGLISFIGNSLKRRLEKTIWKEKEVLSMLHLIAIYLPIALLIQIGINQFLVYLITNDNGQIELINSFGGSFFIEILFFYFGGWISSFEVVGMILLRQIYNRNWSIIKKEKWSKRVGKIWLLLFLMFGLRLLFRAYLDYYNIGDLGVYWILWIIEISIAVGIIYVILNRKKNEL